MPYGSFDKLLVTSERSPLEPQTERKYYAPGLGEVKETVVKGHHETFSLVRVTHVAEPSSDKAPGSRSNAWTHRSEQK